MSGALFILSKSDDSDGTIGVEARDTLKRLPSNVYWYGMGAWGIRKADVSQDEYHKRLFKYGPPVGLTRRGSEDADDTGSARNWHPALMSLKPSDFPQKASFTLTPAESSFLKETIKSNKGCKASLLALLADSDSAWESVKFAWEHEVAVNGQLPPELDRILSHARNFSEIMHGAGLLYNLMLARRYFDKLEKWEEKIAFYEGEIVKWETMITARKSNYTTWDRTQFWHIVHGKNAGVSGRTISFIDTWLELALSFDKPGDIATSEIAQSLLLNRERSHKPTGMARLVNENALRQWSGAAGAAQLDFRWRISEQILTDILSPAEAENA